jgi:hypothetical protein
MRYRECACKSDSDSNFQKFGGKTLAQLLYNSIVFGFQICPVSVAAGSRILRAAVKLSVNTIESEN